MNLLGDEAIVEYVNRSDEQDAMMEEEEEEQDLITDYSSTATYHITMLKQIAKAIEKTR